MIKSYDVIIIGGGPGGYVAAVRARQYGLSVALVEKDDLGGICLNWGCIPTKSLLRNAEVISLLGKGETFGFQFDRSTLKIDYASAQKRSRQVSARLRKGVKFLMKGKGVKVIRDRAFIAAPQRVMLEQSGQILKANNIVIATGAKSLDFPGMQADGKRILSPYDALNLTELPERIAIIGSGAIGVEFASLWNSYGVSTTIIEMQSTILPQEDPEIGQEMAKYLVKSGVRTRTGTTVQSVESDHQGVRVMLNSTPHSEILHCDKALLAMGISPNIENIGLENLKLKTVNGFIPINEQMETEIAGIYAIGDVTGKLPLAHVASAQGILAIDSMVGLKTKKINYRHIPRCVYGFPEVASIGLTWEQATSEGITCKKGVFPFSANGKALSMGEEEGFVKIIADARTDQIVGLHMIGFHVTEIIAGISGHLRMENTVEGLVETIHPHPSISEAVMEAAHVLKGQAIHL